MFRALLCPSSGARDYDVGYHIGRLEAGVVSELQPGNQHHSHELLMMGIVVPETRRAYKKYNKIISGI